MVFVKAWRKWDEFEGDDAQRRAWLLRIKRNIGRSSKDHWMLCWKSGRLEFTRFRRKSSLARLHAAISTLNSDGRRSSILGSWQTGTTEGALKASYHTTPKKEIEAILQKEAESLFH